MTKGHAIAEAPVVHIIEDDALLRSALESLLDSVGQPCRTYRNACDFLSDNPNSPLGCILADVRLPGISGLELQARLAEATCPLAVILMTAHADIPMAVRAMKAGAVDLLLKPLRDMDVLEAVALALARNASTIRDTAINERLLAAYGALSVREREVMQLVLNGQRNRDIASQLSLSEITVKIHRGSAMRKMGARNVPELVQIAIAIEHASPAEAVAEMARDLPIPWYGPSTPAM